MGNSLPAKKVKVATWSELEEKKPVYAQVLNVDLVVVRYGESVSVLYGRCHHRGALMADGHIDARNLVCGVHGWDYRFDTGISEYNNDERLERFAAWIDKADNAVYVDENEVAIWADRNPQPCSRHAYADTKETPEEPFNRYIRQLAATPPPAFPAHGNVSAMGVPLVDLPQWNDIQMLTAQLSRAPLFENEPVDTSVVIGPNARIPLRLSMPIFVTDMSFGALSREAKIALAKGAEMAGTGIASGEGGMLEDERRENSRYFYELAPAKFGWNIDKVKRCQAFHFKAGQAAKTGIGGILPGAKVSQEIAETRGLRPFEEAVSPSRFPDLSTPDDFRDFSEGIREATGGIPIGFKMSAQHIERDIDFALDAGVDYIILDGRGGGTGASPDLVKYHTGIPTIPALARARAHLDRCGAKGVSLVITGGLRTETDYLKALALGADAVAIGNAAIQAIGCVSMRACGNNHCPVGIATQDPVLRERVIIGTAAERLRNYLLNTTALMQVMARACGYRKLSDFSRDDLVTCSTDMASLAGIAHAGGFPDAVKS